MRRALPLLLLLASVALWRVVTHDPGPPPGTVDPRFTCTMTTDPAVPAVGESFELSLTVTAGVPFETGEGALLIGFPHPYYALRQQAPDEPYPPPPPPVDRVEVPSIGGSLPVAIRSVGWGRWYVEVSLVRSTAAGRSLDITVPGLTAPNRPLDGLDLVVLVDPNGDEDAWRICPDLTVPIAAGPAVSSSLVVQSRTAPGESLWLGARREDRFGNPVGDAPPSLEGRWLPLPGNAADPVPLQVDLRPSGPGVARGTTAPPGPGAWVAEVGTARSNALLVEPGPALAWTDLHGHSALADGWGTPSGWYRHARDVAFLDAASLSEHDWQLDPGEYRQLLAAAEAAHDPPAFVTVPSFEINRLGHEVAYAFDPGRLPPDAVARDGARTLWAETDIGYPTARLDPAVEDLLAGLGDAVEVVTHSSLSPSMGTAFPLKKEHPRWHVIEVYSAHGSSECVDCPRSAWHAPLPDHTAGHGSVRDAIAAGYRLGFLAAGDSHDGRPGTSRWGGHPGGLGGVYWSEPSRAGLQDAFVRRSLYGTTGRRTIVEFEVDGVPMGGVAPTASSHRLRFRVVDAAPVESVTLVRDGVEWATVPGAPGWQEVEDPEGGAGSYYLRAQLTDGHLAWSSPVYLDR